MVHHPSVLSQHKCRMPPVQRGKILPFGLNIHSVGKHRSINELKPERGKPMQIALYPGWAYVPGQAGKQTTVRHR